MIRVDHHCEYHLVGDPDEWVSTALPSELHLRKVQLQDGDPWAGILFAGPWIGEFGWELARWQGAVRKRAKESGLYTIVMSDPGHHVLYDDFAHEFWELPEFFLDAVADGTLVRQCDHVRADNSKVLDLLGTLIWRELDLAADLKDWLTPGKFSPEEQYVVPLRVGLDAWSSAASPPQFPGYYCILPRLRRWNPHKNWPAQNWRSLYTALSDLLLCPKVVGRQEEINLIVSGVEIRERDWLTRSIDLLTHAKFAIAPESGGAVLSLLCGCPTLVFGHENQRVRICRTENFLGTKVKYLARTDYNFSIDEVAAGAIAFIQPS